MLHQELEQITPVAVLEDQVEAAFVFDYPLVADYVGMTQFVVYFELLVEIAPMERVEIPKVYFLYRILLLGLNMHSQIDCTEGSFSQFVEKGEFLYSLELRFFL